MRCTFAFLYSPRCQRAALSCVIYRIFARSDRRRNVADPPLHAKFRTRSRTITMEKDMLLSLLSLEQHVLYRFFDCCTVHHSYVLPPSDLFCLNIHLSHAQLCADKKIRLHAPPTTECGQWKYTLGLKKHQYLFGKILVSDWFWLVDRCHECILNGTKR